jgi:hypothetical protein
VLAASTAAASLEEHLMHAKACAPPAHKARNTMISEQITSGISFATQCPGPKNFGLYEKK